MSKDACRRMLVHSAGNFSPWQTFSWGASPAVVLAAASLSYAFFALPGLQGVATIFYLAYMATAVVALGLGLASSALLASLSYVHVKAAQSSDQVQRASMQGVLTENNEEEPADS